MERAEESVREEGDRLNFELRIANASELSKEAFAELTNSIRRMQEFSLLVRASVYDDASPEDRVLLIGSCLNANPDWIKDHPRQRQWLESSGLTVEHCRKVHQEWLDSQLSDPRWRK